VCSRSQAVVLGLACVVGAAAVGGVLLSGRQLEKADASADKGGAALRRGVAFTKAGKHADAADQFDLAARLYRADRAAAEFAKAAEAAESMRDISLSIAAGERLETGGAAFKAGYWQRARTEFEAVLRLAPADDVTAHKAAGYLKACEQKLQAP
jgi:tetratricopeptide (TPR) repeat protein